MEDRKEQAILKGKAAEQLLEEPLFVEALRGAEADLIWQWARTKAGDVEGRERIYIARKMLLSVPGKLKSAVEEGKFEALTLEEQKVYKEFVRLNKSSGELSD